jgi:uncharacterized repeat protein (TIGR01451 family)
MKKLLFLLLILFTYSRAGAQCVSSIVQNSGTCGPLCNAVIAVQFSGGVLPLSVTLTDGVTQYGPFTATSFWQWGNLCPGNYDLLVLDANGDTCGGANNFQIIANAPPAATVNITNATCSICSDGAATATVTGGTAPYTYLWSNGATGAAINGLQPGVYTLYTTDANGCNDIDTFSIGVGANGYYTVGGYVYLDLNSNGIQEPGEPGVGNQQVNMMPGNVNALTNSQGEYAIVVAPGTYDVAYQSSQGWNLTSSPATYSANVVATSVSGLDFGVYPDSTAGSSAISFYSGWPRCFWNVPYYLTVYNNGFTVLNGVMTLTHDPSLTYVSSSLTPTSQIGNVLTYTYSNLPPGQWLTVVATFMEPAGGTAISSDLNITGTDAFGYQFSQNATLAQMVTCSYDPNDKAVQPPGQGASNFVTMDTWLTYMVRFQNTGNDTAFTVVVIDTLDAGLDLSTFTLLSASHSVNVTTRPGNEVTFTFDNILLPDSNINEPASNGYVIYRIKGNAANPDPTVINNTAYIYFDLNSPVITNTTLTTFSDNFLSIADSPDGNALFELFPNPMDDIAVLHLKTPSDINYSVTLMDINGRKIFVSKNMVNGSLVIENNKLPAGTYILEATPSDNSKPVHLRLVKK